MLELEGFTWGVPVTTSANSSGREAREAGGHTHAVVGYHQPGTIFVKMLVKTMYMVIPAIHKTSV